MKLKIFKNDLFNEEIDLNTLIILSYLYTKKTATIKDIIKDLKVDKRLLNGGTTEKDKKKYDLDVPNLLRSCYDMEEKIFKIDCKYNPNNAYLSVDISDVKTFKKIKDCILYSWISEKIKLNKNKPTKILRNEMLQVMRTNRLSTITSIIDRLVKNTDLKVKTEKSKDFKYFNNFYK